MVSEKRYHKNIFFPMIKNKVRFFTDEISFTPESNRSEIQIMRTGEWDHDIYGKVKIDSDTIDEVIYNFDTNKRGIDIAVDVNHDHDHRAVGWIRELKKV